MTRVFCLLLLLSSLLLSSCHLFTRNSENKLMKEMLEKAEKEEKLKEVVRENVQKREKAEVEADTTRKKRRPQGDKHFFVDLGGITQECWEHPDGSMTVKVRNACTACGGQNRCNICQGTGNAYQMIGRYMPCPACGATGGCGTCNGRGYTEMVKTWQPGEAEAYRAARREVEYGERSGGSGHVESSSGGDSRGIRVKEYSPNYTGSSEQEWCDECQSLDFPHYHVWKR